MAASSTCSCLVVSFVFVFGCLADDASSTGEKTQAAAIQFSRSRLPSAGPWIPTLPSSEDDDDYEEEEAEHRAAIEQNIPKEDDIHLNYMRWREDEFRDPTDTNSVKGFEYQPYGSYSDNREGDRKKRDVTGEEGVAEEAKTDTSLELRNLRKFYFVENTGKVRVKRFYCGRCYRRRRVYVPVYRPVYYARPSCCSPCGGCGYGKK